MRKVKNSIMVDLAYSLIPKDKGARELAVKKGNTADIINEIAKTDQNAWRQTSRFAKKLLYKKSLAVTLNNVWMFIKHNIHYQVDELGVQDIKTPASIWHTRTCDCKGYSIFVRSILKNLGIKSEFKYAGYSTEKDVTHVYVIVPKPDGSGYFTIDGCMDRFNMEKPTVKTIQQS